MTIASIVRLVIFCHIFQKSNKINQNLFYLQKNKHEEPHSPYTEKFEDKDSSHKCSGSDTRIAQYVQPQTKPEWKRYKQYTRNDILQAIECVRNGMSALQAARHFKVPSRTLYDKVKKLGITAGRPMNRTNRRSPTSNNGSPAGFPFGISGTRSPYSHNLETQSHAQSMNDSENGSDVERERERDRDRERDNHMPSSIPHPAAALLDPTFLAQAFEARGGDIAGRERLHAIALAAAAHSAVNGMTTSPSTHGTARSPSPSVLMKFIRPTSPSKSTAASSECDLFRGEPICHSSEVSAEHEHARQFSQSPPPPHQSAMQVDPASPPPPEGDVGPDDDDDVVEDLSMAKSDNDRSRASTSSPTPSPSMHPQQLGVIVPPITKSGSKDDQLLAMSLKHDLTIDEK